MAMMSPKALPEDLKEALLALAERVELYVAGGPVRDSLLDRPFKDLDLVVREGALSLAKDLAKRLRTKVVPLDEEEGVFRLPLEGGFFLDLSEFRENAKKISQDLMARDFTINALAVPLKDFLLRPKETWVVIDPTGGLLDLERGLIRAIGRKNLVADPLRLLRAYRLGAELGFALEGRTRALVRELSQSLKEVARERIGAEVKALFEHPCGRIIKLMAEDGLLFVVFPELERAQGVPQPSFHHLDVLGHLLLSLKKADQVLKDPSRYFGPPPGEDPFREVVQSLEGQAAVRLAALFHDVGKPETFAIRHRITFYEHDRQGARIFEEIGQRLCLPKRFSQKVASYIRYHMRPFHLLHEFKAGRLTKRAMRRLVKDCSDYPALFLVAMADSLASAGPDKEEGLEEELAALFWEIYRFHQETLRLQEKERLVTGKDLIELFGLEPGPIFRELLEAVEEARAEGMVRNREEALSFLEELIRKNFSPEFSSLTSPKGKES